MRRIGWTALLLGTALFTAGCFRGSADEPAEPEFVVPETVDGQKVNDALGRALLKGMNEAVTPGATPPAEP